MFLRNQKSDHSWNKSIEFTCRTSPLTSDSLINPSKNGAKTHWRKINRARNSPLMSCLPVDCARRSFIVFFYQNLGTTISRWPFPSRISVNLIGSPSVISIWICLDFWGWRVEITWQSTAINFPDIYSKIQWNRC
jgi:hypothetical protein